MASYNELNALIDAYINRNGVQAITGQILNGVLKAMVEQLGRGYTIMGAAIPTTDPGTPDGPECYFASETGTYTDFDGLQVAPGELALLCYTPSDGWTKATIYEGFRQVGATIDGNVGTPSVGVSYADGVLSFDFHNMKGNPGQNGQDGAAAGFGTIGADITGGVGTPGVSVESSGPATAKNLQFHFTNLKGETGVTSVVATVDNTTGTPACTVSLVGQQLTLAFSGLKGAQGDTGSSVDYPFTIVNNLTTDDATQALSAAQGVVLDGKVTQLEAKVDDLDEDVNGVSAFDESVEIQTTAGTAIPQSAVHPLSIISGREYVVNFISGWSNANYIKVYFADAEGTILTSTFKTMDGVNSDNHFTSDNSQKKVIVSGDATSIRFYTSGTNVIGTGTIVCEVSAPAISGIIAVLNTLQDDVNAEKITISKNYTFEGAGNTIVRKEIKLVAGRIYAIWFSDPEWNDSTITAGNNKFFVDKVVGGVSSGVFGYTKGATVPKEAIMTAETADYYILGFRGDVGESVDICVSDISEVKPGVDSLEYSRNVSIISASGLIPNINTKTKTLDLSNDIVVLIGDKRFTIANDPDAMAVSYASVNSSAIKLLFNTNTQKFRFVVYSGALVSGEILVGSMRVYRGKIINCSFPFEFTIDGFGRYEPTIIFVGANRSQFMRNVNHQGYNDIAPNNTLPAFRLSRQYGFDYAETDVRFTSDGYPVLLHDATVDATSDGSGNIADMTLAEARALDFGSWKNAVYTGTQIPTFEEFLTLCKKIQLRPYIELKAGTEAQIKALAETVVRYGLQDVATFICTVPDWLGYVKEISHKIRLGYLEYSDISDATISTVQSLQSGDNEVFIDSQYSTLTSSGIGKAAAARIPVEVWTLATVATINELDPYISGVTSNQKVASRENYLANIGDAWGM